MSTGREGATCTAKLEFRHWTKECEKRKEIHKNRGITEEYMVSEEGRKLPKKIYGILERIRGKKRQKEKRYKFNVLIVKSKDFK